MFSWNALRVMAVPGLKDFNRLIDSAQCEIEAWSKANPLEVNVVSTPAKAASARVDSFDRHQSDLWVVRTPCL